MRHEPDMTVAQERVLLVAPFGSDAGVLRRLLQRDGMEPTICAADPVALGRALDVSWDILILTAEACRPDLLDAIAARMDALPVWSAPPVVLIGESEGASRDAAQHLRLTRKDLAVSILIRPCMEVEIATAAGAAREMRAAQYRVRDLLEERKRAEDRATFLFHELSHRVANLFAMIKSLSNQTLRREPDPRAFRAVFNDRLDALAGVYKALRADEWEMADLDSLVRATVLPLLAEGGDADRVEIDGPPTQLDGGMATSLGLALHELGNNARKYGALSTPDGGVRLHWWREAGRITLQWREFGGPAVEPPEREGFGTTVIRSALRSVKGATVELEHHSDGLRCEFVFPAEADDG
jgi:two-component sensor histidine kinase